MNSSADQPSGEDVLEAFAVERDPGRETLERYLRNYPQFATELVDLSRELAREVSEDEPPLTSKDRALIDDAWRRHAEAPTNSVTDPFAGLSTPELRKVAKHLDIPRQVIAALRERRVMLSTVPQRFLAHLAEALDSSVDILVGALSVQPPPISGHRYKAERRPAVGEAVSFERVLIDAGVPSDKRAQLMMDGD